MERRGNAYGNISAEVRAGAAMSTLIGRLLPSYVACAECEGNDSSASLLPGEEAGLDQAVESRVREFATTRACARRALNSSAPRPLRCRAG